MEHHGQRLLPSTIDKIAHNEPTRAWAAMPRAGSTAYEDITIATFANAINRVAHWIVDVLGSPTTAGTKATVAYVAPSDLRYYVFFVAIVKAGYVPLFTSHLNSKAANHALFESTNCQILLNGFEALEQAAVNLSNLKFFRVPSAHAVWDTTPVPAFPFIKSFAEASSDPLLILHTSESSGIPKPITIDVSDYDGLQTEVRLRCRSPRNLIGLPPFHAAGFLTGLQDSIYFGLTIVFPPSDRPVNAQAVCHVIDHANIQGAALLPHVLEDIAKTPEALERLKKLIYVGWAGGPIFKQAGDLIAARTNLINAYASTELGAANTLAKRDQHLWPYYFFHPNANGFDFRPVHGQLDLYELFVVKDPALPQQVFRIFPQLDEWPMKDLFRPHPTLAHHWRLEGRSDDLIVLKNASKFNPREFEAAIRGTPGVKDALFFGTGRHRIGAILEPIDAGIDQSGGQGPQAFLDRVWPVVEMGNTSAPENGKVVRELVLVTKPEKPFPRSGKRTVQRGVALDLYRDEIEEAYSRLPAALKEYKDYRIGSNDA